MKYLPILLLLVLSGSQILAQGINDPTAHCYTSCYGIVNQCWTNAECRTQLETLLTCANQTTLVNLGTPGTLNGVPEEMPLGGDASSFDLARSVYSRECYPVAPVETLNNMIQCFQDECIWNEWTWNPKLQAFISGLERTDIKINAEEEFAKWDLRDGETNIDGETVTLENWSYFDRVERKVLGGHLGSKWWVYDGEMWDFLENGDGEDNNIGVKENPPMDCGVDCVPDVAACMNDDMCISNMAYMVGCSIFKCKMDIAFNLAGRMVGTCLSRENGCMTEWNGFYLNKLTDLRDLTKCFAEVCYPTGNDRLIRNFVSCMNDNCDGGVVQIGGAGVLHFALAAFGFILVLFI